MEKIIVFGKGAYWEYKKETIKQQYEVEVILDNAVKDSMFYEEIMVTNPINIGDYLNMKIFIMSLNFLKWLNN